jgi:hypothetical protein
MNRTTALDSAHGLLVALCEETDAPSPAAIALMEAFNLVVETHAPARLCLPREREYPQRLVALEHLLNDLADSAPALSEHLTLRDATDLVRHARAVSPPTS